MRPKQSQPSLSSSQKSQSKLIQKPNCSPQKEKKNHFQLQTERVSKIVYQLSEEKQNIFLCGVCSSIMDHQFTNMCVLQKIIVNVHEAVDQQFITPINFVQILIESSYYMKNQLNIPPPRYMQKFQQRVNQLIWQVTSNKQYIKQKWENYQNSQPYKKQAKFNLYGVDAQSRKLIQQIRQQDIKQRQQLQNKKIQCQICLQQIKYIDMGTLSCGHIFHKICISSHIQEKINKKIVDIPCPAGCPKKMPILDIQEYITPQYQQKYDKYSLDSFIEKSDSSTSWCPTAGCTAIFSYDNKTINIYRCTVCKKSYCLSCRCEQHKGMSCAQYRINNNIGQNDKKFFAFIKGAKFKQCPKCKFWVQRSAGCNAMVCRCGANFCYDCGGISCPHGSCSKRR